MHNRMETSTVYLPKMLLFDLLLYLIGVIGLWLGLDFLNIAGILNEWWTSARNYWRRRRLKRRVARRMVRVEPVNAQRRDDVVRLFVARLDAAAQRRRDAGQVDELAALD